MPVDEKFAKLLSVSLSKLSADPVVHAALEDLAGDEVFLEARKRDGSLVTAINWEAILKLLPTLIPAVLALFTGGLTPAAILAIVQALLSLFGIAPVVTV